MTGDESSLDAAQAARWLSAPRYRRYLDVASGDHALAMETYLWNSRVAAAGIVDVGHLEVALRNAYDRELTRRFPDWAIDPQAPLFHLEQGVQRARDQQRRRNQTSLARIADAKRGLSSAPTHAEVVAALTFGFWSNLTVGERTPTLWNPMLHRAFPKGTRRARVHDLVARVVKFRNRLAHNEPVFSTRTGLEERLVEVQELFELIDPDVYAYVTGRSTLDAAISSCPISGLTSATGLR
ncbi:hypothetical protein ACT3SZ_00615 [Corynebacterium sp. AOP40-9SA-29]|uniref:hypothetical protein n=1 Tax=Corynebacterium sp. AOP40-9SA-29 TaxID=3457677 RepID=UPI004033B760